MTLHYKFRLKTAAMLHEYCERLHVSIPCQDEVSNLFDSIPIGYKMQTPNRFVVHPMEGFDADRSGSPQDLTFRRYGRYASGGAGIIWFEATAVVAEGRSNPRQLFLHKDNVDIFKQLTEYTRERAFRACGSDHSPVLVLQLTHSGRYSKPEGTPAPIIAHHSAILDPLHDLPSDYPLASDEYLHGLQHSFVEASKLAARAGFDGVDIKSCHRYLFSELLASTTRENSAYGGSFENRTRMIREIAKRIVSEVPEVFVTTRLNAYDAIPYPYGFGVSRGDHTIPDLREPVALIGALRKIGLPLLNLSIGNPYYEPHIGRPFDIPIAGGTDPESHPLENIARFIDVTRQVQQAHPKIPVIASGYSWLRHLIPHVAAAVIARGWATLLGQGRNSFAYPDAPRELKEHRRYNPRKVCITCSACTQIMRDGGQTGCVIRDREIYGERYREGRRLAPETILAEARRCRACETPACRDACPAQIDIPGFIGSFVAGDLEQSYAILKARNTLPEICARVCPTEIQCEGACIEHILGGKPVPVRDIQLHVAQQARKRGIATARLGPASTRRMAVIGAGPAGIACAARLLQDGHAVDLYDTAEGAGGTPLSAIPAYRLAGGEALAEIESLFAEAIDKKRLTRRYGEGVSQEQPLAAFAKKYDAVFLGIGLSEELHLPGALPDTPGVIGAMTFLRTAKSETIFPVPDTVCVIGGGNTAIDAAITAKQNEARDVSILYRRSFAEMPAWPAERSRALDAGIQFLILTQPVGYVIENNALAGIRAARTILGEPDASGRRKAVCLPDSEAVIPAQLAIEALGQAPAVNFHRLAPELRLTSTGLVAVNETTMETSLPRVFAGGDLVNGGTTAVQAIAEGLRAADHISSLPPKRSGQWGQETHRLSVQ